MKHFLLGYVLHNILYVFSLGSKSVTVSDSLKKSCCFVLLGGGGVGGGGSQMHKELLSFVCLFIKFTCKIVTITIYNNCWPKMARQARQGDKVGGGGEG